MLSREVAKMSTGVKVVAVHMEARYREQVIRELHDFRLLKLEIGPCEEDLRFLIFC